MRKTKKQLFGLIGLAAVAVMTVVAYAMPTPAAAEEEPVSDSTNVTISVQVNEQNMSGTTVSPANGSQSVDGTPTVVTNFSNVKKLEYKLEYYNENTKQYEAVELGDLAEHVLADGAGSGTWSFKLNLGERYGEYKLTTTIVGRDDTRMVVDTTVFYYRAILASIVDDSDATLEPTVKIEVSQGVEKIAVYAYDKEGNPLFVDKDGKEVPVWLNRSDIDPATGLITTTLPFEKYGATAGEYSIVVVGYNGENDIVGMVVLPYTYKPVTPDTPNTGSMLGNLNISRADYLITGLLAFGLVAGFALYLVFRKERRDN